MGTNYYLRRREPCIRPVIHIAKASWGWRTSWQSTTAGEWSKWCDEDMMELDYSLPWSIHSVADIRAYLETGDWEIVDEYGDVHGDDVISSLESWMPDGGEYCDYHDGAGNGFTNAGFC